MSEIPHRKSRGVIKYVSSTHYTDRQIGGRTDRQSDSKQTGRRAGRRAGIQAYRQTDIQAEILIIVKYAVSH